MYYFQNCLRNSWYSFRNQEPYVKEFFPKSLLLQEEFVIKFGVFEETFSEILSMRFDRINTFLEELRGNFFELLKR